MLFENPVPNLLTTVISPKSCASPVVAIVINSIIFTFPEGLSSPPIHNPLVGFAHPHGLCFVDDKLPKSTAFPDAAIVTKSIVSTSGFPPPHTPRVAFDKEPIWFDDRVRSPKSLKLPVEANSCSSIMLTILELL